MVRYKLVITFPYYNEETLQKTSFTNTYNFCETAVEKYWDLYNIANSNYYSSFMFSNTFAHIKFSLKGQYIIQGLQHCA